MAKSQPLKLSDLRSGVDYPVGTQVQERRCLFHVKLTDFSMRSIESLINSDKGAFFSLWFADGGGTISIPGSKEDRKFNFKTSQGDIDGLECVHQAVDSVKQPRLNCWGQIRYKLQVQGTKEVYERTKKLMKETEEQKQKTRTQTINFPHSGSKGGRSKSGRMGGGRSLVKNSSPFSSPSLPSSSHSSSTSSASATTAGTSSASASFSSKFPSVTGSTNPPGGMNTSSSASSGKNSGGRKSSKTPHTLRERIIHLLAVKPHRRTDVINRLKKETKRGDTAMSKTDSLLLEVADIQGDMYHLKQSLYTELNIDDWPFYSDAERQLVKRKHGGDQANESLKRSAAAAREPPPSKRQKLTQPHSSIPPLPSATPTQYSEHHPSSSKPSANNPSSYLNMPRMDYSNTANPSNIEMLPTVSSVSTATHATTQSSSMQRLPAQYPGSILSNFIRANSSSLPPSSLPPSSLPPSSLASTNTPVYPVAPTTHGPSQTGSRPTGQASLATAAVPGQASLSRIEVAGGDGVGTGLPVAGGKLFGDLVSGGGGVSDQSMGVDATLRKKEKKKKKKNKTKERPPAFPKAASDSYQSFSASVEGADKSDSGTVKSEEGKREGVKVKGEDGRGGDVKVKSEDGRGGGDVMMKSEKGRGDDVKVKSEGVRDVKVKSEVAMEENGASSTTPSSVDFSLKFPPITSDATRAEYKRIFNDEYQEYLVLKGQIEVVNNEVTALSEQMAAVKRGTDEAKILKRKIREKYTDLQQNVKYQSQKRRFQELHSKLGHIKKLVVEYDKAH